MRQTYSLAIALLVLCAGCHSPSPAESDVASRYTAQADAVVVLAVAASPIVVADEAVPTPPEPKPGGVCPSCDGSGKSGDGQGRCGDCKGTGKATAEQRQPLAIFTDSAAPVDKPLSVVMHLSVVPKDHWTVAWWRDVRPVLQAQGVDVTFVKEPDGEPWLAVCGSTCARVDGQPTTPQLQEILKEVK